MRFDIVRTGLEYVPERRRNELVDRLLRDVVAPGGRLVIGVYDEDLREGSQEQAVADRGFPIAGRTERAHFHDDQLVHRAFWIDAGPGKPKAQRLEN
jgi:hypothetical protein